MTNLTGTAMRPFGETLPLAEARALIDAAIVPIERTERVRITDANGRIVSAPVVSAIDVPPFTRAGMDGYAVRAADVAGATRTAPQVLTRVATVFTGDAPGGGIAAGQCVEIATGAPLPAGADAVVLVEETLRDGDRVTVYAGVTPSQNVGRQGCDIARGATVLQRGDVLNASRVGALAALGCVEVEAFARPTVAILSTGNEIVEPGQALGPGQIYDVNRFTLSALVADNGCIPVPHQAAGDTLDDLSRAVDGCLKEDVIVFSGGSSVGERDLILDVLRERGEVIFHGIAVKPGKPTAFGRISGRLFFAMPGYPASCLSNGYVLLAPALRRLAHLPPALPRRASGVLAQSVKSARGRHQFYPVRLAGGIVTPAFKASGDITSLSQADGYIEIPADTELVEKGSVVEVTLF